MPFVAAVVCAPCRLCSRCPGTSTSCAKLRWQCRDRPGDGIANRFSPMTGKRRPVLHARDGAVAFHSGKMQQHCEPRGAFHQSADRRSAQADDQVTFPVSGYGPISCFRRSFTDHDLRRDEGFAPPAAYVPEEYLLGRFKSGRRDLKPALRACCDMLGWWERFIFALLPISEFEKWEAFQELAAGLYPGGPDEDGLWERAGADDADLSNGRDGRMSASATTASTSGLCALRSVPFGKYCRSSPLVFSFVPRCQGLCGSQK